MKSNFFHVSWDIDMMATSHRAAARKALQIQRDANSLATVFDVTSTKDWKAVRIDLSETKPTKPKRK